MFLMMRGCSSIAIFRSSGKCNYVNALCVVYDSSKFVNNGRCVCCRTHGGALLNKDTHEATAPVLMWVKALDMLMDRLILAGVDFTRIAAISGSAQVHLSKIKKNEILLWNIFSNFSNTDQFTGTSGHLKY